VKVSELEGRALDAAVHIALHPDAPLYSDDELPAYSTDWAQGGPLIDEHPITIERGDFRPHGPCKAWLRVGGIFSLDYGPTPLIAAMRAYVASVFGETVPDETAAKPR
jgi:hypothetical protein